jgi:hypothetical protein
MGSAELSTATLARCVELFNEFARDFATFRIADDGSYEVMPQAGSVRDPATWRPTKLA